MVESNYSKNLAYCSKRKVGETNYSKDLAYCSKRKVVETNYSKNKFLQYCSCMYLCVFSNSFLYGTIL